MTQRYFHGGFPGLKPGNFILPPTLTKAPSCSQFGATGVHRTDRVYLCTHQIGALIYAVLYPTGKGVVYECEPVGEVEPDPDWTGPAGVSVQVEKARVVRVYAVKDKVRASAMQHLVPGFLEGAT